MVDTVSQLGEADDYYISDLGLNKNTFDGFLAQINRLLARGNVHYFDHHPLTEEYRAKLASSGMEITHSVEECASVLVFRKYEEEFRNSPQMKVAACCGAITDYMDLQPYAKKLISSFDRQFLLYEATVLAFTIASVGRGSEDSNSKLVKIAGEISEGRFPHELEGASEYSQAYVARSAELITTAKKFGKKVHENFAYMVTKESSTGNVANFLVGAFDVLVGVAIREEEPGFYEISTRSIEESKHDLGKILGKITAKLGTSGGGHPHAAGARIKRDELSQFIRLLDEELSKAP
ncbi:MAG TPA: DHH family phosphoesterase [Nitrososphaerales archaeon]|nr:DHH family phosphoesterase [Nitrososphaerales archaeon]